jgi:hypothetical protein
LIDTGEALDSGPFTEGDYMWLGGSHSRHHGQKAAKRDTNKNAHAVRLRSECLSRQGQIAHSAPGFPQLGMSRGANQKGLLKKSVRAHILKAQRQNEQAEKTVFSWQFPVPGSQ